MQLKWGTYAFDANACMITSSEQTLINEGGQPFERNQRIRVVGFLSADGQAALTTASQALETALRTPYRDLLFYQDDGSVSATSLYNSTSLTGVKIIDGPNFPSGDGEYATVRRFDFTAEASYPVTGTNAFLLTFRESLEFIGGGPRFIYREAINDVPQRQDLSPATTYKVIQSGMAIGYRTYPIGPPQPLFPAHEHRDIRRVREEAPQRRGNNYTAFPLTWQYTFESNTPLIAHPNVWRG